MKFARQKNKKKTNIISTKEWFTIYTDAAPTFSSQQQLNISVKIINLFLCDGVSFFYSFFVSEMPYIWDFQQDEKRGLKSNFAIELSSNLSILFLTTYHSWPLTTQFYYWNVQRRLINRTSPLNYRKKEKVYHWVFKNTTTLVFSL